MAGVCYGLMFLDYFRMFSSRKDKLNSNSAVIVTIAFLSVVSIFTQQSRVFSIDFKFKS